MVETQNVDTTYKVGRVLTEYNLEGLHEQLPTLWLGETRDEVSLRDLADRINVALIHRALERAGEDPLDGEAENVYRLLTADDVSGGVRIQQRNRLERAGVDVDELESDLVTHQAVYTYLTQGLGVSKERTDETDPIEKHETRIQRFRNRFNAVIGQSISELQESEHLETGQLATTVAVQLYCQDCETQYELTELFEKGGCDCDESN